MSNVQGQIDRINGEVTTQASLISQIATALEGKTGGVKELQTATGTKTGDGTQTFAVSGLAFKPSHVVIIAARNSTTTSNIVVFSVGGIAGHAYATATNTTPYSYIDDATIAWSFSDDGFSVTTTKVANAKFNTNYTYRWIALE